MSAAYTASQQSTISLPFMGRVSGGGQQSCAERGHPSGSGVSCADSHCLVTVLLNAAAVARGGTSSRSKESQDARPLQQSGLQYRRHKSVCQYRELDILVNAQYLF